MSEVEQEGAEQLGLDVVLVASLSELQRADGTVVFAELDHNAAVHEPVIAGVGVEVDQLLALFGGFLPTFLALGVIATLLLEGEVFGEKLQTEVHDQQGLFVAIHLDKQAGQGLVDRLRVLVRGQGAEYGSGLVGAVGAIEAFQLHGVEERRLCVGLLTQGTDQLQGLVIVTVVHVEPAFHSPDLHILGVEPKPQFQGLGVAFAVVLLIEILEQFDDLVGIEVDLRTLFAHLVKSFQWGHRFFFLLQVSRRETVRLKMRRPSRLSGSRLK